MFNPENCTEIYAVHPDDGSLIRLENNTVGVPQVSFEVAAELRKAYSGSAKSMSGHDYQRANAEMIAKFTHDSRRRPKIKANNQALRASTQVMHHAEVAEQLATHAPKSNPTPDPDTLADLDDDFLPASRRTV